MRKFGATMLMLLCVSLVSAGKFDVSNDSAEGAINNPKRFEMCHDGTGKWNPTSKSCDPEACGCLFHQIEEFLIDLFK